jgi:hypothetical protein
MISRHRTLKGIIVTPFCLLLSISISLGSEFTIEKLPIYPNGDHAMFDGTVGWHCGEPNKICYYDGTKTEEIAKPAYTTVISPGIDLYKNEFIWKAKWYESKCEMHGFIQRNLSISGSSKIYNACVYFSDQYPWNPDMRWDIRLYRPKIHNGSAVWEYHLDGKSKIMHWDGSTVNDITSFDHIVKLYPSIYNDTIAWSQDNEIFYWDGEQIIEITNNNIVDIKPSLYKTTIAWEGGGDIYYWDGSKITQITESTALDENPSLYNGRIAWQS